MSQTRTILNFIHQNGRQNSHYSDSTSDASSKLAKLGFKTNATPKRLQQSRLLPPVRKPLALRFPFSECTDVALRQSREAVVQGFKFAVSQYQYLMSMSMLRHFADEQDHNQDHNHNPNDDEQTLDTDKTHFWNDDSSSLNSALNDKLRLQLQLPSILVHNSPTNREEVLVAKLQEVVLVCLQKRFGLSDAVVDDVRVREALNYATNLFLQAFKSSSTKGLCSELSENHSSGQLAEGLYNLAYDFLDKYEEIALEHFEDIVVDGTCKVSVREPGATVEKPVFYECFRAIWKLDPPNLLEFGVNVFLAEYNDDQDHYYSNMLLLETLRNKYGANTLKMNIHRFFWCYRDELRAQGCAKSKAVPDDLDKMEEFAQLRDAVEQIMLCEEEQPASRARAKLLRFADQVMVE